MLVVEQIKSLGGGEDNNRHEAEFDVHDVPILLSKSLKTKPWRISNGQEIAKVWKWGGSWRKVEFAGGELLQQNGGEEDNNDGNDDGIHAAR